MWSLLLPFCACAGKNVFPSRDIVEIHISAKIQFQFQFRQLIFVVRHIHGTYHKHILHDTIDAEFCMRFMMKQLLNSNGMRKASIAAAHKKKK